MKDAGSNFQKYKFKGDHLDHVGKRIYYIRLFILMIFLLTLADAVCTAAGISLGVIGEGNPILKTVMEEHPSWTAMAVCIYTGGLLALVYRFGARCRSTIPLLAMLFSVKVAVIGLHLGWIATL